MYDEKSTVCQIEGIEIVIKMKPSIATEIAHMIYSPKLFSILKANESYWPHVDGIKAVCSQDGNTLDNLTAGSERPTSRQINRADSE